jgi:hypothetical protein
MKQGKPLKRTPLQRGESKLKQTPLNRGNSQLKRTPLAKRSPKMVKKYVERRKIVGEMLQLHKHCEACIIWGAFDNKPRVKQRRTQDVHELVNRSQGGSILEDRNLFAICRPCHTRVTESPYDSMVTGLHMPSWCKTDHHYAEAKRVRESWKEGIPTTPYWDLSKEHADEYPEE